ncbi:carboxymuconolactone decarboxylase family protein [Burkholderia cepacia]|uniref:carboxymuconolactone decarboxylase family protein n=1 Tax=Burkholderia cepacia TaxID=292 RepID=UPI00075E9B3C|nr:hypothetical protein [Burkholderia cepacia]
MRLAPIPPEKLTPELRRLHEDMISMAGGHLEGFVMKRADGALVGPFNPMLHFPQFGEPFWNFSKSLIVNSKLPKAAREVAILVTGARFNARYELYAHEFVAHAVGVSAAKIASIAAGQRPADLSAEEGVAYDVAAALTAGKQLPTSTYQAAVDAFGEDGVGELCFLVAGYCMVSVLLNAFDISVPGREEGLG